MLLTSIFSLSTLFSTLSKKNYTMQATLKFLSATALNLDKANILLYCRGLRQSYLTLTIILVSHFNSSADMLVTIFTRCFLTRSFFLAALLVAMASRHSLTSCICSVPRLGQRFCSTKKTTLAKSPTSCDQNLNLYM